MIKALILGLLRGLWDVLMAPLRRWLRDREVRQETLAETRYKQDAEIIKAVQESQHVARTIEAMPPDAVGNALDELHRLRHPEAYNRH